MITAGIIAEYNPFHNGHALHIRETRLQTGADYVVAVMSPDFVQRGACALADKYSRTRMALLGGADLVLELPVLSAAGSAEYFAFGSVRLLCDLGCVNYLSFGCETPDLPRLKTAAEVLSLEPSSYQISLKTGLSSGMTYPRARQQALSSYLEDHPGETEEIDASILSLPNNILGIEYLRALRFLSPHSDSIQPVPIRRIGPGYQSDQMDPAIGIASASALRNAIREKPEQCQDNLSPFIPPQCLPVLLSCLSIGSALPDEMEKSYSRLLHYRLLSDPGADDYLDISEDLARRIHKLLPEYRDADQFVRLLKTRQMTQTRIQRALLHLFLGIRKEDADIFRSLPHSPYIRILGFRQTAAPLLHTIKKNCTCPLITKTADAAKILKDQENAYYFFLQDIKASHLYQVLSLDGSKAVQREYTRSPIILP